ncbi:unnamed protein product, partial [Timema podura]|nr:unnamed protein product [Timema podura]
PQSGLDEIMSPDFSTILSNFNFSTASTSIEGLTSMQGIFELDANCNVVLQGRIGQLLWIKAIFALSKSTVAKSPRFQLCREVVSWDKEILATLMNQRCETCLIFKGRLTTRTKENDNTVFPGFYGEVYKGSLEQDDGEVPQLVAVKKLKANTLGTIQQDFEREISIMKVSLLFATT